MIKDRRFRHSMDERQQRVDSQIVNFVFLSKCLLRYEAKRSFQNQG